MSNKKITGIIVKDYLSRFPKIPALTLAKKIYKENPEAFMSVEAARRVVLYYLGQCGSRNRQRLADTRFVRPAGSTNPFNVPESDCKPWEPVHVPSVYDSGLVMSDMHFPYHDIQAINAMLEYTIGHTKPNFIIINGDGLDCYSLSRFSKDPRNRSFNDELWQYIEFINILQDTFSNPLIYWKLGNHEKRWEHYLRVKAPELIDMDEYHFGDILKKRGVENVEVVDEQIIYTGRLPWLHGHEMQGGAASPVNPARGLFLKTLSSAAVSHHHRSSAHAERDINGKLMSWWSIACLCGLHPEYALVNKWNHGFAFIKTEGLEFEMENMKIYNGKVYRD